MEKKGRERQEIFEGEGERGQQRLRTTVDPKAIFHFSLNPLEAQANFRGDCSGIGDDDDVMRQE